jgi:hypothetical protein
VNKAVDNLAADNLAVDRNLLVVPVAVLVRMNRVS